MVVVVEGFVASDSSHPVDLSNSRAPPASGAVVSSSSNSSSSSSSSAAAAAAAASAAAAAAAAAFYGAAGLDAYRRDAYKPNGLSLSLGIADSGEPVYRVLPSFFLSSLYSLLIIGAVIHRILPGFIEFFF